jgi:hypothetical protein
LRPLSDGNLVEAARRPRVGSLFAGIGGTHQIERRGKITTRSDPGVLETPGVRHQGVILMRPQRTISAETRARMSASAKRRASTPEHLERARAHWQPFCSREALEADYITAFMSQQEIAKKYGVTLKRVQTSMRRYGIQPRRRIKRNQRGPANSTWRGAAAKYDALHVRVIEAYGQPSECSQCGRTDDVTRYEWANLTGRYEDVTDYARMCASCHHYYDAARRRETGQLTTTGVAR